MIYPEPVGGVDFRNTIHFITMFVYLVRKFSGRYSTYYIVSVTWDHINSPVKMS